MLRSIMAFAILAVLQAAASAQFDFTIVVPDADPATMGTQVNDASTLIADVEFSDSTGTLVEGFSFGISNGVDLSPVSVTLVDPAIAGLNGGSGADFVGPQVLTNGVTIGVIFDFDSIEQLTFPAGTVVAEVEYTVADVAADTPSSLNFVNTLGMPVVGTAYSVGGFSFAPTINDADFTIVDAGVLTGFIFRALVPDADPATAGIQVNDASPLAAQVELEDTNGQDVQGFSFGLANTAELTAVAADVAAGPVANLNGGLGPDFVGIQVLAGGVTVGIAFDTASVETLSFLVPTVSIDVDYTVADVTMDTPGSLNFSDMLGTVPVSNAYVVAGLSFDPDFLVDSNFTIVDAGVAVTANFFRGECNNNFMYDLSDGIFLLNSLNGVGPDPDCPDSCDFDGDGQLEVMDAVDSFTYLFIGGAPPAAPFPNCAVTPIVISLVAGQPPVCTFDQGLCP